MNRRSFIASILAAGIAPAVVGSGILMPVRKLWTGYDIPFGTLLGYYPPSRLLVSPEDLANANAIVNRYYNDFLSAHADHFSASRHDWRIETREFTRRVELNNRLLRGES